MFPLDIGQTNVASQKSQLDEIVRNLKIDLNVWHSCQTSGWLLVNELAKIHGKCLTCMKNIQKHKTSRRISTDNQKLRRMRRELKIPSEKLLTIVNRLLDATEQTRKSLEDLRLLSNSGGNLLDRIFYCDWQLREILEFVESIMPLYDAEYEIKDMVAMEIINSTDHEELRLIRQAWQFPRHALTPEFKALFQAFEFETRDIQLVKS